MTVIVSPEDLESERQAILQEYGQNEEEALENLRRYANAHNLHLARTKDLPAEEKKAARSTPEALENKAGASKYKRFRKLKKLIEEREFDDCAAACFF